MNVTKVINHYGNNFIVTANVNYDKRGLPDPLVLAFYFTARAIAMDGGSESTQERKRLRRDLEWWPHARRVRPDFLRCR